MPGFAIKALYGEMATIVTTGVRAEPARLEELGYEFHYPRSRALRTVQSGASARPARCQLLLLSVGLARLRLGDVSEAPPRFGIGPCTFQREPPSPATTSQTTRRRT